MPGYIHTPASSLAELSPDKNQSPQLIILSGPPGAGKSSWCLHQAKQATAAGLVVGGLISPAVILDSRKVGIDLVDQVSGERRRLATRQADSATGIRTRHWLLDPDVLAWGNRQLLALPSCDVVFLDELGPQELLYGRGLIAGLELIDNRRSPSVVAVVRPKLLPTARERWPWGEVLDLTVDRPPANDL